MATQTVKEIKKDIYLMIHKTDEMLKLIEDAFTKNTIKPLDQATEIAREIHLKEDELTAVLAKLASSDPAARAVLSVPPLVEKAATSMERIIENIRNKIREGLLFSDKAMLETSQMIAKTSDLLKKAGEAFVTASPATINAVLEAGDAVIRLSNDFATAHEDRLVTGECSPKASSTYLCILYAFEDIASFTKDAIRKVAAR